MALANPVGGVQGFDKPGKRRVAAVGYRLGEKIISVGALKLRDPAKWLELFVCTGVRVKRRFIQSSQFADIVLGCVAYL